ncbi:hypothetical protein [Brevibacillus sp. NRS-1366]|uniref:hypothetical protein n=1 Tax=Brevibacillus sp. NRS-1366 TaxID=3233899 RepID=UPI003D19BA71
MDQAYLERVAGDLRQRISSLIVNDQPVGIRKVEQSGAGVNVITNMVNGIAKVTSVKLLDENGGLITRRTANMDVPDSQILEFRFEFTVKGETS